MSKRSMTTISTLAVVLVATAILLTSYPATTNAHCQVPCGIYDDAARIKNLKEDATTIAKAITNINQLAGAHDGQGFNQAARWVATKEDHASHIITTVAEYFLTQKVKPAAGGSPGHDAYLLKLADHHAVMVAAMKCKQSADPATVTALNRAIDKLATHY